MLKSTYFTQWINKCNPVAVKNKYIFKTNRNGFYIKQNKNNRYLIIILCKTYIKIN